MLDKPETVAQAMTQGGAAVAVGSWGVLGWLNDNSAAVVALCAIAGLVLSMVGLGWQMYLGYRRGRSQ